MTTAVAVAAVRPEEAVVVVTAAMVAAAMVAVAAVEIERRL